MKALPDYIVRTYHTTDMPDQFAKDMPTFKGRVYAVRVGDEVQVKLIFASITSVFQFIASLIVNPKNTYFSTKAINQIVNDLTASQAKIASVASQITPPPPAVAATTIDKTEEALFKEKYFSFVEQTIPFLDGWLSNLKELAKGADSEMLRYIKMEVNSIKHMIVRKQKEVKEFGAFKNNPAYKEAMSTIRKSFAARKKEIEAFGNQLVPKKRLQNTPIGVAVPGIQNAGNSCYMNSALQGLLASPLIIHRIKAYNKNPVPKHESFMPILKEFLVAYLNKSNEAIGQSASKLRAELYQTRLKNLDVPYLSAMADADLIVMVLGEALQLEYPVIARKTAQVGVAKDKTLINDTFISEVKSSQLLWNECKTSGAAEEPSLQERFIQDSIEAGKEHDLGWNKVAKDGTPVTVNDASIAYKIDGPPPPLLVFKVGKSHGAGMDAPFTPYSVQPRDEFLDASKAFEVPPEDGAKYRLISVLINHGREHWTALSRREDGWYNCNDSSVTFIGKDLPHAGAAVMIYELVTA